MSIAAIVITAVIAFCSGLYVAAHGADVKGLEAKALAELIAKEEAVRAEIKTKIAVIIADVKAWDAKALGAGKDALAQVEARLKQIL